MSKFVWEPGELLPVPKPKKSKEPKKPKDPKTKAK